MKSRTNWFTVASMLSLVSMVAYGLFVLISPKDADTGDITAIVVLGFASLITAVFAIYDIIERDVRLHRELNRDAK